jgi:hypothetical protein
MKSAEINFKALIPPVEDASEMCISRRIQEEISQELYSHGKVEIYRESWEPQHLTKILEALKERGYEITNGLPGFLKVSVPPFPITEKVFEEVMDAE